MNSFNNNFINSYKLLSNSVVGLEFEFFSNYSLIKTMELLNLYFSPIEIWAFNQYHSEFEVNDKIWKIEPDFSGGSEMVELITGKMSWIDAKLVLAKMLNFIKLNGYTDDHCSIHINISFTDIELDMSNLNPIKLILNFDEAYVYDKFPNRRNNIYARSIQWIVPFEDWENSNTALNSILQGMKIPDDTKYYGINIQKRIKGYLEYRYIGGANYENKIDEISDLMDYFILQSRNAINSEFNEEDNIKLLSYLEDNINWFKQYKSYDTFLANVESIEIQVDQSNKYEDVSINWDKFKNKLFEIIKSCDSIQNCIINFNSNTNRMEIVDGTIKNIHYLKGVDFVNCTITECTIFNCDLIECDLDSGHIYNSNIYESKINNAKLTACVAKEWTELNNCLFDSGTLDCIMKGGVFRSGILGENADIDNTVKMAVKSEFWHINPSDKKIKGLDK